MASTEIKFRRDTSFRKSLFSPDSFAHPAKMDAQLLLWIMERYTKAGDTILDPMAGSGTAMIGCTVGRNIVQVELEQKFVEMQKINWDKVRMMPQLGHEMGECHIIQGDARHLGDILADHAIFSPPYAAAQSGGGIAQEGYTKDYQKNKIGGGNLDPVGKRSYMPENAGTHPDNIQFLPYGDIDSIVTSPPYAIDDKNICHTREGKTLADYDKARGFKATAHPTTDYSRNPDNLGNLPYGSIDSVITSPPYEAAVSDNKEGPLAGGNKENYGRWREGTAKKTSYTQHGEPVDHIITSPPYEDSLSEPEDRKHSIDQTKWGDGRKIAPPHSQVHLTYPSRSESNIGNLKGDTYLSAMLQVYQQCRKVLKPGGLMVVVTKNFIRNKKEVRLDEDTIRLCEQAGFKFVERHYRKLPAQSFWRVIYQQKYPDAPVLDKEDILVFQS